MFVSTLGGVPCAKWVEAGHRESAFPVIAGAAARARTSGEQPSGRYDDTKLAHLCRIEDANDAASNENRGGGGTHTKRGTCALVAPMHMYVPALYARIPPSPPAPPPDYRCGRVLDSAAHLAVVSSLVRVSRL